MDAFQDERVEVKRQSEVEERVEYRVKEGWRPRALATREALAISLRKGRRRKL